MKALITEIDIAGIKVNETNLATLEPEQFLDDTIMHSYLITLVDLDHVKK